MARASVGLGESLAPSALTDMVARIVPAQERSRTVTFVGAGLYLGTILGLNLNFRFNLIFAILIVLNIVINEIIQD